ncbi:MAG: hypothetical protein KIS94_11900 [Chitinophagales bacterium]|nr:hypothetical protein [Chitinophagales bacterium]
MKKIMYSLIIFCTCIYVAHSQTPNEIWQKYDLKGDSALVFSTKMDALNFTPLANLEKLKLIDRQTGEVFYIQSYNWFMIINYEMYKSALFTDKNKHLISQYTGRLKPKDKVVIDEIVYSNGKPDLPKRLERVIF